ncbi:MAG TPA: GNAT family N-acetyltransferase [Bryobacteraceae bacterium]|nr:GNAT family N-acetyltransferase [Bryobacteraceae bacterium]
MSAAAFAMVQLGDLIGRQLEPLLLDETVEWERELDWDFSRSAELVRHFTDTKSLAGAALLDRGEVVGYGYAVIEEHKALVGDVYMRPGWRTQDAEVRLFGTILDALTGMPGLRRIESQLMLLDPAVGEALRRTRPITISERMLMSIPEPPMWRAAKAPGRFRIEGWSEHHQELAATVIALAYAHHVDSRINEQYLSVAGARRFLSNIVQYPGCGTFFRQGSMVAFDARGGWVAGMVLASMVAPRTGHITQLCVTPQAQGTGLGRELLQRSMDALYRHGAQRVSLTVTAANRPAVELYRSTGFREMRRFLSYTWDGK